MGWVAAGPRSPQEGSARGATRLPRGWRRGRPWRVSPARHSRTIRRLKAMPWLRCFAMGVDPSNARRTGQIISSRLSDLRGPLQSGALRDAPEADFLPGIGEAACGAERLGPVKGARTVPDSIRDQCWHGAGPGARSSLWKGWLGGKFRR